MDDALAISVDTARFSREVLIATVQLVDDDASTDLPEVRVLVSPLKSKAPMRLDAGHAPISPDRTAIGSALSTIKRTAEAAGLRILISRQQRDDPDSFGPGRPVIVLGGLNDSQLSNTLNILTAQPLLRLEAASGIGRSSKWGMYSVAALQELRSLRDVYYTYIHDGFRETLDHILVSQHFYDFSRHRIWSFERTRIYNDHLKAGDDRPGHQAAESDHGIVTTLFEFNPASF